MQSFEDPQDDHQVERDKTKVQKRLSICQKTIRSRAHEPLASHPLLSQSEGCCSSGVAETAVGLRYKVNPFVRVGSEPEEGAVVDTAGCSYLKGNRKGGKKQKRKARDSKKKKGEKK